MIIKPLARALARQKIRVLDLEGYVPSAVLVPLFQKKDKYHVLFTQRTDRVKDHKNQISFPGGVQEDDDPDLLATALRESEEELGLDAASVEVLGRLGDIYTPTHYRITPYVGVLSSPLHLSPNPQEISEIIEVPLDHLLKPENMRVETADFFDREFDIPYFRFKKHTIWGATGRITRELLDLLGNPQGD